MRNKYLPEKIKKYYNLTAKEYSQLKMKKPKEESLKELTIIPGVGKSIAVDLWNIGITSVSDLKGKDPEMLFNLSNKIAGKIQDRCLLYVFRCAVYFAETPEEKRDSDLLKWWSWKN